MTKFAAVEATDEDLLTLEMRGIDGALHEYEIRPVSGEWWWKFAALNSVIQAKNLGMLADPGDEKLAEELDSLGTSGLRMLVLGEDNVTAMLADKVSGPDIMRAVSTAFAWHASGGDKDQAERVWSGKARTPPATSTSTAAAPATRARASSSGTTSRRKSKQG